jgi:mannitol/fructose-specific phosphotransferase system IIA component (Ntr-type)
MVRIDDILDSECILTDLPSTGKSAALRTMTDHLESIGRIANSELIHQLLLEREGLMTTGVRRGFAFPHVFNRNIEHSFLSLGAAPNGIEFDSLDGEPVRFIFLLLGPPGNQSLHLPTLARVSHLTGQPEMLETLGAAATADDLLETLRDCELRLTAWRERAPGAS